MPAVPIRSPPPVVVWPFVMVGSIAVAWLGSWLPLLCLPLALVGFLDDRHNLPAGLRYGVQVATALWLLWISPLPALAPGFWLGCCY